MPFSVDNTIYSIEQLNSLLEDYPLVKDNKKKHCYLNVASSFDIETTSFYIDTATHTKCKRIQRKMNSKKDSLRNKH